MKYSSRLTALLLALMMIISSASAELNTSGLTVDQLNHLYEAASEDPVYEYLPADVLGFETALSVDNAADLAASGYTFQWYEILANGAHCEIVGATDYLYPTEYPLEAKQYYCIYTDPDGIAYRSKVFVIAATTTDLDSYLNLLYSLFSDDFGVYDSLKIYEYMTDTWNITLSTGENLAQNVMDYWWSDWSEENRDCDMLCTCVASGKVASDYTILHPNSDAHDPNCYWAKAPIVVSADVSTPDLLQEGQTIVLTSPDAEASYFYWQEYRYNAEANAWEWESVSGGSSYELTVNADSIQAAYRVISNYEDDIYVIPVESRTFFLGGEEFHNWIKTANGILPWLSEDGVTVERAAAKYSEYLANKDEEDRTNATDYTFTDEDASVNLQVSEDVFAEDYVMEIEAVTPSADVVDAVLKSMDATGTAVMQVLKAFDISFAALEDRTRKLQPSAGQSVALTFEVSTADVPTDDTYYLYVYHIANDGTPEVVAGPVQIAGSAMTIEVQADGFSTYLVMATNDECVYCQNHEYCFYDELLIEYKTPAEQYGYLQGLDVDIFAGYISDYVRHIEAGAPPVLCNCVDYTVITKDGLKSPEDEHQLSCPWGDKTEYDIGLLGLTTSLSVTANGAYEWYLEDEDGTRTSLNNQTSTCEATYGKDAKLYICAVTTSDGTVEYRYYVQADMTNIYQYMTYLGEFWAGEDRDRHAIYEWMTTTWNVQMDETEGNTLAKAILVYWKYNYFEDYYYGDVLCSCCIDENGVVSDQLLLHPDTAHYEECPWWNGLTLEPDVPVIPDQPPLYNGKPNGAQYSETLEYTLPMEEDHAVILQTGGRAILTSENTTPGVWQVYTGEEWVDIQGETSNVIEVTEAKLASIFARTGIAQLRYYDETNNEVLDTVQITTQQIADGNYPGDFEFMMQTRDLGVVVEETEDAVCNLVINYVFADGKTAAPSWTSTGANGAPFVHDPVKSPAVTGYAPDAAEVVVARDNLTAHITWTVIYRPALVTHTVEHYFQKLGEVGYAETPVVTTHTGYTGSEVGTGLELPTTDTRRTGFYALPYESTVKIAADGSTVTEIYYDRYYFLMTFDMNGGFGVESIYAQYGTAITAQTPTRYGYVFTGWKNVDTGVVYQVTAFEHANMPAYNTEYKAQWIGEETTFDVVFWYENADDDGYSQAGTLLDQTGIAGTTVQGASYQNSSFEGRDSTHFTFNAAKTDKDVVLKGDGSTVVNVYFTRNVYTLTFVISSTSGCTLEEHKHDDACYNMNCTDEPHNHVTAGCTLGTGCTHTAHGTACYRVGYNGNGSLTTTSKPTQTLTDAGNGIYTYTTTGSWMNRTTHYYVQIGEQWYRASNGDTTSITFRCSHTHSDACYSCGKTTHAHSGSCYGTLKCTLQEHYHEDGKCYYVVRAKYDADIKSVWANAPVKAVLDAGNAFQWSATSKQVSYMEKMPGDNTTMTQYNYSGSRTYYWRYYLETLPGKEYDSSKVVTYDGKTYFEYDDSTIHYSNTLYLTYDDDYYDITGFDQLYDKDEGGWYQNGSSWRLDFTYNDSTKRYEANLYYTRNSYDLTFSNYGTTVADKGGTFLYEQDISGQYFVPEYPSTLPAGAYEFAGWYTSPYFAEDSKFEFTTTDADGNTVNTTMPANDVTLYAYWKEIEFTVKVYDDADLQTQLGATQEVPFNQTATPENEPTNGDYIFVGWFYMENGVEKAFDFSMPITKDMVIYAKWSSNVLKQYTIKYAVENADGSLTYIADDTVGYALAGNTKTFDAKAGTELDAGYQTGYYPETNSHSLTLSIDDETKNTFTFIYVQAPAQPYTVYYLAKEPPSENAEKVTVTVGGKEADGYIIHTTKNEYTTDAVHTETFVPVTGYRPDAYQKSLVVSTTAADNVIVFWYEVDNVHAPVQVIHYIQNEEGEDYRVYQSSTDLNAIIGDPYSANVLNLTGFEYKRATANGTAVTAADGKVSATVTAAGLILELYYDRIEYPYEFRFVEQGNTSNVLHAPIGGEARYGAQVTQTALSIPGYTCVDPESKAHAITIKTEEGNTAVQNVKTFYYSENTVDINYIAVLRDENGTLHVEDATGGTVKLTGTTDVGAASTQELAVKAVTGNPKGATAEPNAPTYKFVGWYVDATCRTPVTAEWVNGNVMDPQQVGGLYQTATYYALFELDVSDLTIVKEGMHSGESAVVQVVITNSEGTDTYTIVLNANVDHDNNGTPSVVISDVLIGSTYTVTELDAWTWRYKDGTVTYTATPDSEGNYKVDADADTNTVTVTNSKETYQWLSDESAVENNLDTGNSKGLNNQ